MNGFVVKGDFAIALDFRVVDHLHLPLYLMAQSFDSGKYGKSIQGKNKLFGYSSCIRYLRTLTHAGPAE